MCQRPVPSYGISRPQYVNLWGTLTHISYKLVLIWGKSKVSDNVCNYFKFHCKSTRVHEQNNVTSPDFICHVRKRMTRHHASIYLKYMVFKPDIISAQHSLILHPPDFIHICHCLRLMSLKQAIKGFVKKLLYTYKQWSQSSIINFLQNTLDRDSIVCKKGMEYLLWVQSMINFNHALTFGMQYHVMNNAAIIWPSCIWKQHHIAPPPYSKEYISQS